MEMEIKCSCGAKTILRKTEDSEYTDCEGWYVTNEGDIKLAKSHYQIFFYCEKCGKELWMFT